MSRLPTPPASPFKGLASFEESTLDAMLFFGREREREIITANLLASRLTVLYGPSGVGKSSLLRAGVAHQLLRLEQENRESGRERELAVVVFSSWSGDVLAELRAAVVGEVFGDAGAPPSKGSLADDLAAWTEGLGIDLYLILDQAEEYFVYHGADGDERSFVRQFPQFLRPGLRVNCLVSLREEALAALDVFKAEIPNLLANRLRLARLDREAGRAAIVGPLGVYNELVASDRQVELEPALVDAVLGQVEAGALDHGLAGRGRPAEWSSEGIEAPYLQLVMQRLWEVEQASGSGVLTLEMLRELGGARQVVEDHLERALGALTPPEQDAAAGMFGYLVTPSGTKIAHGLSDLRKYAAVSEPELVNVLERLSAERILRPVSGARNGGGRYEIFHDVLADAVLAWRGAHEARRELDAARRDAERQHRTALTVAGVALFALAVMAAITVFALTQRETARAEARRAHAGELVATALSGLAVDPQQSLRLAVEAAGLDRSPGAEDALRKALLASRERRVLRTGSPVSTALFDPGAKSALVGSADGFARLFDAKTGRLLHRLRAGGPVRAASFGGRDGLLVATGSETGSVRLWGALNGKLLHSWRTGGAVGSTSFNREGTLLLAASADGTARIWPVAAGHRARVLRQQEPVLAASFSPDGARILTMTPSAAWLFDARSGRMIHRLRHGTAALLSASFSPDGKTVVTTSQARTALLWDVATGRLAHELKGHVGQVTAASFSPDNTRVVTASTDETARVWDTRTGAPVAVLPTHTNRVTDASFSPDGKWVVTASLDRIARIFRASSGGLVGVLAGHRDSVVEASFASAGDRVITASPDGTARIWDPGTTPELQVLGSHQGPVREAAFSPGGRLVISAGDDHTARVWRVRDGRAMRVVNHNAPVTSASFASSGTRVLTTSLDRTARISGSGAALLLHAKAGVRDGSFSADGKLVVTAAGGAARIWAANDGALLQVLHSPGAVQTAEFSPDGKLVVTAADDGTARLWETATGRRTHVLRGHRGPIVSAGFSPDGRLVLTAGEDATARLWDASTGMTVHVLRGHTRPLTSAAFSPDGRLVATSSRDTDGRIWSVATGRTVHVLRGHNTVVNQVRFSVDGRWVVTAGPTNAGLWPVATGRILLLLRGHDAKLTSASFSRDGRLVLTSSEDRTVRLYRCEVCAPIDRVVTLATRRLAALAR